MRVVIVNAFAHVTGGADQVCFAIAEELRARGHGVRFLATASDENVEADGVFVPTMITHATRDLLSPSRRLEVAARALWNSQAADAMRSIVADFRPDVVHTHKLYPQLSVAPVVVANKLGIPLVQTLHDYELISASALDPQGHWRDRYETRFQYRTLNAATYPIRRFIHLPRLRARVAVSRSLAAAYKRHGVTCEVLPNFIERDSQSKLDYSERRGVAFAGRLVRAKGVVDLLEVARRMPETAFTIAGEGPLAPIVRSALEELQNLRFIEGASREQVLTLFRSARVVLVPSRWQEPGPLVALEAMARGTPLVTYSVGGLAEYVRDAGAGRTVDAHPSALAQGCRELVEDEREWIACSRRSLDAVEHVHSADRYLPRLERVYRDAVQAGGLHA